MKLFSLEAGNSRIFGLDLLRFFAIIFVVIGHSMLLVPKDIKPYTVKENDTFTSIAAKKYVDKNLMISYNTTARFLPMDSVEKVAVEKPTRLTRKLVPGQIIQVPKDGKFRFYVNVTLLDGVAIFFVLSGFLIGGILVKLLERNPPSFALLLNFWNRRWLRTLPMYFLILGILLIFTFTMNPGNFPPNFARYLFFVQNFNNRPEHFFGESWSLCIEEWFYFVIPLLLFGGLIVFKTRVKTMFIWVISVVILGVVAYRYAFFNSEGLQSVVHSVKDGKPFLMLVTTRIDCIVYGVLGAFLAYYYPATWKKMSNLLLVILAIAIMYYTKLHSRKEYLIWLPVINSVCVLCMLPYLSNWKTVKWKFFKFITFISLISYSMYLINLSLVIHTLIKFGMNGLLNEKYLPGSDWYIEYGVYWILTIGLSFICYKFVEIPFMNMRKKEK